MPDTKELEKALRAALVSKLIPHLRGDSVETMAANTGLYEDKAGNIWLADGGGTFAWFDSAWIWFGPSRPTWWPDTSPWPPLKWAQDVASFDFPTYNNMAKFLEPEEEKPIKPTDTFPTQEEAEAHIAANPGLQEQGAVVGPQRPDGQFEVTIPGEQPLAEPEFTLGKDGNVYRRDVAGGAWKLVEAQDVPSLEQEIDLLIRENTPDSLAKARELYRAMQGVTGVAERERQEAAERQETQRQAALERQQAQATQRFNQALQLVDLAQSDPARLDMVLKLLQQSGLWPFDGGMDPLQAVQQQVQQGPGYVEGFGTQAQRQAAAEENIRRQGEAQAAAGISQRVPSPLAPGDIAGLLGFEGLEIPEAAQVEEVGGAGPGQPKLITLGEVGKQPTGNFQLPSVTEGGVEQQVPSWLSGIMEGQGIPGGGLAPSFEQAAAQRNQQLIAALNSGQITEAQKGQAWKEFLRQWGQPSEPGAAMGATAEGLPVTFGYGKSPTGEVNYTGGWVQHPVLGLVPVGAAQSWERQNKQYGPEVIGSSSGGVIQRNMEIEPINLPGGVQEITDALGRRFRVTPDMQATYLGGGPQAKVEGGKFVDWLKVIQDQSRQRARAEAQKAASLGGTFGRPVTGGSVRYG